MGATNTTRAGRVAKLAAFIVARKARKGRKTEMVVTQNIARMMSRLYAGDITAAARTLPVAYCRLVFVRSRAVVETFTTVYEAGVREGVASLAAIMADGGATNEA